MNLQKCPPGKVLAENFPPGNKPPRKMAPGKIAPPPPVLKKVFCKASSPSCYEIS